MDASREYEITSNFPVLRFFGHSAGLSLPMAGTPHQGNRLRCPGSRPLHSRGGLAVDPEEVWSVPCARVVCDLGHKFARGNRVKYGGGPLGCGAAAATFGVP